MEDGGRAPPACGQPASNVRLGAQPTNAADPSLSCPVLSRPDLGLACAVPSPRPPDSLLLAGGVTVPVGDCDAEPTSI